MSGAVRAPLTRPYAALVGAVAAGLLFASVGCGGDQPPPTGPPAVVTSTTMAATSTLPPEPESFAFGVSPQGEGEQAEHALITQDKIGVELDIVAWFVDWTQPFPVATVRSVAANGWLPAIFWEPWDHTKGPDQLTYASAGIAAGDHDAYLRKWAAAAAAYADPVMLIFAPEMNSESSVWAPGPHQAAEFVAAWRHVHSVFAEAGATNVQFVWAPAAVPRSKAPLASVFPGVDYVDAVGMTVFNGGADLPWGGWREFADLQHDTRAELERLAPGLDVVFASVASAEAGGDKALWIRSMFEVVNADPNAVALIWFDHNKEVDWRIDSSPGALDAIRAGASG